MRCISRKLPACTEISLSTARTRASRWWPVRIHGLIPRSYYRPSQATYNVAALVPPYEEDGRYHGTSAALEFAVTVLCVEQIIIIGHAHCGGVAAMVRKQEGSEVGGKFIGDWTDFESKIRGSSLSFIAFT